MFLAPHPHVCACIIKTKLIRKQTCFMAYGTTTNGTLLDKL